MAEPAPQQDLRQELKVETESELTSVARVRHTQGRRGEVAADILTDFPERFKAGAQFLLAKEKASASGARECLLEDAWFHKGQVILKFAGVYSISEAEELLGHEVMIPRAERKEPPAGTFYLGDLIGCRVMHEGRDIGRVADWEDTGGGILLHVDPGYRVGEDNEILIPFAQEICREINIFERVIRVRLPEGLLDLNSAQPVTEPLPSRGAAAAGSGTNDD